QQDLDRDGAVRRLESHRLPDAALARRGRRRRRCGSRRRGAARAPRDRVRRSLLGDAMASPVQAAMQAEPGAGRGEGAAALRGVVSRLAGAVEGSVLLFARERAGAALRLRTAAGFASPEAARAAADALRSALEGVAGGG